MTEIDTIARQLWDVSQTAIYLAGCALHDLTPELDGSEDLDRLFAFCQRHTITAMVAMALERYWKGNPPDPAQEKQWKQAKDKAIRKNILLNAERERILKDLEEMGCWYLPLKGILLQHDYPRFGMRQMSDNDILIDEAMQNAVHSYMCSNGYQVEDYHIGNHDAYMKPPVYNFEMHWRLFGQDDTVGKDYYTGREKELLVKDAGNRYGYHMTWEDFYIYMTSHAYKHYDKRGTGLRSLVDVYVFLDRHGDALDWSYTEGELAKIGISDFEAQCRKLGEALFRQPRKTPELSDGDRKSLLPFLQAGTYGTQEQAVENALKRMGGESYGAGTKLRYLLRRMFPPLETVLEGRPELKKQKWKIPLVYIRRIFSALFTNRKRTAAELASLRKAKDADR